MKVRFVQGLSLAFALLLSVHAQAYFMEGATGHTETVDTETGRKVPGVINFAVLDREEGGFGDTWGTGMPYFNRYFVRGVDAYSNRSPGLDANARYLYLYQVTHDGREGSVPFKHASISIHVPLEYITSWGAFPGLGFADDNHLNENEPLAVSATNPFGQKDSGTPAGEAVLNVFYPSVVRIDNDPADPGLDPQEVLLSSRAFRQSWVGGDLLEPGRRGTIFGFTSNLKPALLGGRIIRDCGGENQPPCPD